MTKFKDTLDAIEIWDKGQYTASDIFMELQLDTIRLALKIADKVMQEPSEAMCEKCDDLQIADKYGNWKYAPPEDIFRAMIEQMLIELKA